MTLIASTNASTIKTRGRVTQVRKKKSYTYAYRFRIISHYCIYIVSKFNDNIKCFCR